MDAVEMRGTASLLEAVECIKDKIRENQIKISRNDLGVYEIYLLIEWCEDTISKVKAVQEIMDLAEWLRKRREEALCQKT